MSPTLAPRALADILNFESFQYQAKHVDDDKSLLPKILCILAPFVCTTAVVLRLWSRKLAKAPLLWDDYAVILSLLLTYPIWALYYIMYWYNGVGRHAILFAPDLISRGLESLYLGQLLYAVVYPLLKISILLLFHRVFVLPKFRMCVKLCIALVTGQLIGGTVASAVSCFPAVAFWDLSIQGRCVDMTALYYAASGINIATDLVILFLPMPIIWRLNVAQRQKNVLCTMFLLGSAVCIATVFRIITIREFDPSDMPWTYSDHMVWTIIELSLGVVCACVPTMRPLIRGLRKTPAAAESSPKPLDSPRFYTSKGRWVQASNLSDLSAWSSPCEKDFPTREVQWMDALSAKTTRMDDAEKGGRLPFEQKGYDEPKRPEAVGVAR
ncbi:MAG: hypothetical protein M1838_005944 [Thelocarpon superellum]|nr:MAG: hypothetical protein M1838_005944 [Thelocarpon superellum]